MKPNRFQAMLAEGKAPIGHMIFEFATRGVPQMLEACGVDFVIIDMEHSGFTQADVANLIAWFKATPIAPFVRIPELQYHFIARSMDAGALGIVVPNVKNALEARTAVEAVKYAPLGRRGMVFGDSHTHFRRVHPPEFMEYSNRNTTVICQIESKEGLANVDEIAATPGVDALFPGEFDLHQSMGIPASIPLDLKNEEFQSALRTIARTAKKHGRRALIQPGNIEQAKERLDLGYDVLSFGGDIFVYISAVAQGVSAFRKLMGER